MTVYDDIAAILHPMPGPGALPDALPDDVADDVRDDADRARKETAFALEAAWDAHGDDAEPLLSAIAAARRRREDTEAEIRRLIAYGREFTRPRPYKLAELAAAAGMSVSGVRTAYDHQEVADVQGAVGRAPREWRTTTPDDPPRDDSVEDRPHDA